MHSLNSLAAGKRAVVLNLFSHSGITDGRDQVWMQLFAARPTHWRCSFTPIGVEPWRPLRTDLQFIVLDGFEDHHRCEGDLCPAKGQGPGVAKGLC